MDRSWPKVKNLIEEARDIYIGTVYISPNENKIKNFKEVRHSSEKGIVFIQGDFSAHTGNVPDYIASDKYDKMFGIQTNEPPLKRNSEDNKILNKRGKFLLDFCKSDEFLIANGRKTGDEFGKYTSFQWNGCRVVDYVLSSFNNFNRI